MAKRPASRIPPILIALVLQFLAFLLSLLILRLTAYPISPLNISLLTGITSAMLSRAFRMAGWWLPIQLLFAPCLFLLLGLDLPPAAYLAAFVLLALVYWSTFRSQVPLYLSSRRVWHTLEEILPAAQPGKRFTFIDIGSGTAGGIAHLARMRPDVDFVGIENAPLPYLLGKIRVWLLRLSNCTLLWGNMWELDFSKYDVVYAYLSPVPMLQLWEKSAAEMKAGSLLISNTFNVPDHPPDYSITLEDWQRSTLHVWHMPK